MNKTHYLLYILTLLFFWGCKSREEMSPSQVSEQPTQSPLLVARTPSVAISEREDARIPLPDQEPPIIEVQGLSVRNWAYRLTNPAHADNAVLMQCRLANDSQEPKEALLLMALEYAGLWATVKPAWFRENLRLVELAPGQEMLYETAFPELQVIHMGIQRGIYIPRVRVMSPREYQDQRGARNGVKVLHSDYEFISHPRSGLRTRFVALLRNFDEKEKRVTLETRLSVKPQFRDKFEGNRGGYSSEHIVLLPSGQPHYYAFELMNEVSGVRTMEEAREIFDFSVQVLSVQ